jgi:hypothetical protein
MILRPSPGLETERKTGARCLPNLVGDSPRFSVRVTDQISIPLRPGRSTWRSKASVTDQSRVAGSADAGDRVRVRRIPLRPGDNPPEQLEAVDETGSGAHEIGVGVDGPDLVVPTGRRRRQLGEHGTGLLGGLS